MPTYAFRCHECGAVLEVVMGIGAYVRERPAFACCGAPMGRYITTAPGLGMVSERSYDGLRAQDGTPIDTRAKHRAYMKANNLTTVDDFAQTWAKDARERAERLAGDDPQRSADVARAIEKLGG